MPPTMGWARRTSASVPSRRRTKSARLSSASSRRRGTKGSAATLSLPGQESNGEARNGSSREGAIRCSPSGTGSRREPRRTRLPACSRAVGRMLSASPTSRQRSRPRGFSVMIESGPRSMTRPSRATVSMMPPARALPSSTVRSSGMPSRAAILARRCAAARPEMPAPTTTMRFRRASAMHNASEARIVRKNDRRGQPASSTLSPRRKQTVVSPMLNEYLRS